MGAMTWDSNPGWITDTISLDSLGNDSLTLASSDIQNDTDRDMLLEVELVLGAITPTGAPYIELHVRPRLSDDSNFADAYLGGPTMVDCMGVSTGLGIKRLLWAPPLTLITIRPGISRLGIGNRCQVSFAGSGNHLKHRRYTPSVA
jgi:hypothetical protein